MIPDVPPEKKFIEVGTGRRIHPYGVFKTTNLPEVEVISTRTDPENRSFRRIVMITNGTYRVWVPATYFDEYGYELRDDERVSEAEFHAIGLKQQAMQRETDVRLRDVQAILETDPPQESVRHYIIAAYYAAKADPAVSSERVDFLREYMTEQTGHIDTSHLPTVMRILDEGLGSESAQESE